MSDKGCLACAPEGAEGRAILVFLRRALIRLNNDYQPDLTETCHSRLLNDLAFPRLLATLFRQRSHVHSSTPFAHSPPLPSSEPCPHSRFSRYLRRKLRCDAATFNGLCGQLIKVLAERNYHLSVLEVQIKSALATSQRIAASPDQRHHTLLARLLSAHSHNTSPMHSQELAGMQKEEAGTGAAIAWVSHEAN